VSWLARPLAWPADVLTDEMSAGSYLNSFNDWMSNRTRNPLYAQFPAGAKFPEDAGLLLSGQDFEGYVVGYARTAAMCSSQRHGIAREGTCHLH
jgi:hypothetical protein